MKKEKLKRLQEIADKIIDWCRNEYTGEAEATHGEVETDFYACKFGYSFYADRVEIDRHGGEILYEPIRRFEVIDVVELIDLTSDAERDYNAQIDFEHEFARMLNKQL